ncbi:MAG: type II toxin-antitoxin system HicA family toxin [Leptolyngbyaceae cyanobacterium RU_5_1]|nr:type II toxin-antitoxin system HicA family toxin [Leptolyngbyaceae cyanobacterium RU_5_1]
MSGEKNEEKHLNNKHQKTLQSIFTDPIPANIRWNEVESLFEALGAIIKTGSRSRRRVALNGVRAVFHEPHPEPDIDKGMVKSIRRFLESAGIEPPDSLT